MEWRPKSNNHPSAPGQRVNAVVPGLRQLAQEAHRLRREAAPDLADEHEHVVPALERASTTWSTSSFTSYHGQLLSLAVQWGVAIEIERAIKKSASFC